MAIKVPVAPNPTVHTTSDLWCAAADSFATDIQQMATDLNSAGLDQVTANAAIASAAAQTAVAATNAQVWVSGTTYAVGDVRYSPVDYQSYRRKTAGAGTTDPSSDSTNWAKAIDGSIGKHTIWIPAAAMQPRVTNGPSAGVVETTTNKVNLRSFDFDTTTQEFVQFGVMMPKSWNEGTVSFKAVWSHAATTVNFGVTWNLAGLALGDTDAADAAFGTAQQVQDTGGTTNTIYVSSESTAITIAGTPQPMDYVIFQLARVPADGNDTMAIDARLHGIHLYYNTDVTTDV